MPNVVLQTMCNLKAMKRNIVNAQHVNVQINMKN